MATKTKTIQEQIAIRNAIWKKSTKRQRAVLVAKDVIERLNTKQFHATPSNWLNFTKSNNGIKETPLQECILEGEQCNCCAMGGLMASTIAFRNKVTTSDLRYHNQLDFHKGYKTVFDLSEIFPQSQLALIEQAFEGGNGAFDFEFDNSDISDEYEIGTHLSKHDISKINKMCKTKHDKQIMRILSFYKRYEDEDNRRMRVIMLNIIRNKGVFVI